MSNLIDFTPMKKSTATEKLPRINLNDPEVRAEIGQADRLVSYDINAMSIEELRDHARYFIVMRHKVLLSRSQQSRAFSQIIRLMNAFLERRRKEELGKYHASNKLDTAAKVKSQVFAEIMDVLPEIAGSTMAREFS